MTRYTPLTTEQMTTIQNSGGLSGDLTVRFMVNGQTAYLDSPELCMKGTNIMYLPHYHSKSKKFITLVKNGLQTNNLNCRITVSITDNI